MERGRGIIKGKDAAFNGTSEPTKHSPLQEAKKK
jgi:hypothetical protein